MVCCLNGVFANKRAMERLPAGKRTVLKVTYFEIHCEPCLNFRATTLYLSSRALRLSKPDHGLRNTVLVARLPIGTSASPNRAAAVS
jgi:hypothetical protein